MVSAATATWLDCLVLAVCIAIFVGYHMWLMIFKRKTYNSEVDFADLWGTGRAARTLWSFGCAEDKNALLGVQTIRNAIMACTAVTTLSSVLATLTISTILDAAKMERADQLELADPLTGGGKTDVSASIKLAVSSLPLFICFVWSAHSIRIYVHLGFYLKAVGSDTSGRYCTKKGAVELAIKAGVSFSVALRALYAFIPLGMWLLGPTALLVTTIVLTLTLWRLDTFHVQSPSNYPYVSFPPEDQELLEAVQTRAD